MVILLVAAVGTKEKHFEALAAAVNEIKYSEPAQSSVDTQQLGVMVNGRVLTPDGRAASGAQLAFASSSRPVNVDNGDLKGELAVLKTDADGKFSYSPPAVYSRLVVVHDSGMALMESLKNGQAVRLQAWAKAEGTVRLGAKPAVGEVVSCMVYPFMPDVKFSSHAATDIDGRFCLNRIQAGEGHIGRQIRLTDGTIGITHALPVFFNPGDMQTINIGGTGRPIVGQITVDDTLLTNHDWTISIAELRSLAEKPKLEMPESVQSLSGEAKQQGIGKWLTTIAGKTFMEKLADAERTCAVIVDRNGKYRVEDVPAGVYSLNVQFCERLNKGDARLGEHIATAHQNITVPEMTAGRSDEPLDAGTLAVVLKRRKIVSVGESAPDFSVRTLEGQELKLSNYKGKYVLLDFWATWCGPCLAEIPAIKAAYEAYGTDDRFVVISLSLDDAPAEPLKYVRQKKLKWLQGFLGERSKTTIPDNYGVDGIPSIWLIGPDGKVLAKDLSQAQITDAVTKALTK